MTKELTKYQLKKIIDNHKYVSYESMTTAPYKVLYLAFRECYDPRSARELSKNVSNKNIKNRYYKTLQRFIKTGHQTPLEHVSITFTIDNVTRAFSHQLVRHRLASYSQASQRYIDTENFINYNQVTVPTSIIKEPVLYKDYKNILESISKFIKKGKKHNIPSEDLRSILPNATHTSFVFTANLRELIHIFNQRLCTRAQKEIREVAKELLNVCVYKLPIVFNFNDYPICNKYNICFESKKFSCKPELCI